MKQPGRLVVWSSDLDSAKSRKDGRKLAKSSAVQAPRLEEINEAAKRLSMEPELVPGKARPNAWWDKAGYAILPKNNPRTPLLRSLAGEIKKIRTAKTTQEKTRK